MIARCFVAGLKKSSLASLARYVCGIGSWGGARDVFPGLGAVAGGRDGWTVGGLLGHKWLLAPMLPRLLASFFHNLRFAASW